MGNIQAPVGMNLDKLVGIPIVHPLRYRCELILSRGDTYQRQDIQMVKGLPNHNPLVEPLYWT